MSRSNTPSGHPGQPPLVQGTHPNGSQPNGSQQWRMPPELDVPPSRGAPAQVPTAAQYVPYPPNAHAPNSHPSAHPNAQAPNVPAQPGYAYPPQVQPTYAQPEQAYGHANPQIGPGGHLYAAPPAAYAAPDRYAAAVGQQMPDLRGSQYDQWPNHQPAAPLAPNPQAYDLGNYNPAALAGPAAYQQPVAPGYAPVGGAEFNHQPSAAYASTAYGNYAPPQAEYQPQQQWSPQDMAYQGQQAGYAPPQSAGYAGQPGGHLAAGHPQAAGQVQAAADYDDDEYEDEEVPRRRGRGLIVVAALVGAIGLGGGLAYGYKTFMKPPTSGNIPVARADKDPAKIKPSKPDGKQMAGNDSTLRNDGDAAPIRPVQAAATASADGEGSGSRKVTTMQIGRDGSIAAPPASAQPQPVPQQQTMATTVPGMQMVMPSTPSQQRAMPVPNLPEPQPVQPRAAAPVQPRVAAVPAPLNAAPEAAPPAVQKKVVAQLPVPKKPVIRDDLAAGGASALGASEVAAPPVARKTTGAGFMPVLSIHKTEIEAMRTFADLQQKSPALQDKKPITQVIAEGKYAGSFRLMVGPPGSMAAAKDMCAQSGVKDCYPMPY